MRVSALRREVTPARERIFCSRSSATLALALTSAARFFDFRLPGLGGLVLGIGNRKTANLFELLQRRQLAQIHQPELNEELFRGLVENGLANYVLASGHGDQLSFEQRLH